ncbi:MFS transporter [Clostridium paraputrificum]|uniref:MFS transporter n=1 Tax=Clostridium paraputrificum TaxID=29363 RepID=UPI0035694F3B
MNQTKNNWKRRTLLFLSGQCITLFGSMIVQMAIIWYVTLKTSSGGWVAAFTICSYLPQFLISFFAGVWADRYSRKKLILLADGVITIATLIMFVIMPMFSSDLVLLSALLIISIVRSIGAGIQTPAVNAVIPQLVPEEYLMKYNGINATMQSIVQFAAPAVAGTVLSVGTFRSTLFIDIVTALIGIGLLSCVLLPKQEASNENASVFAEIKAGISYAFSDKMIGKILIVYGMFILLSVPAGFMAALLVSRVYGDVYWYLTAVELVGFAGMALGGVLMGMWGGFKSRLKTFAFGLLILSIMTIGMGISPYFVLYLAMMFVYSIALTMIQTATTTIIQENAQESMLGRVFGLMGAMYSGFLPIGMAIFGPLADMLPLQGIMVGSGIALVLVTIYLQVKSKGDL